MRKPDPQMLAYYHQRAPIYDEVYRYPERQDDLRFLENYIPSLFIDPKVLEIAAGTGYWTQFIARKAKSILATDITANALSRLDDRDLKPEIRAKIDTQIVDGLSLRAWSQRDYDTDTDRLSSPQVEQSALDKYRFNAAFAGLWISHIPKQELVAFLESLQQLMAARSRVVLIDNSAAQCKRIPITNYYKFGNSYQQRSLPNGERHQVLKNFPTESELIEATDGIGQNHNYLQLENFWLFEFTTI